MRTAFHAWSGAIALAVSCALAAPQQYGVSFVSLNGWNGQADEKYTYVLNNISTPQVQSKLAKTFAEYKSANITVVRLMIDPHHPGFHEAFQDEYPPLSAYPNVPQKFKDRIASVNTFIDLAYTYGIKTCITFGPPKEDGHVFADKAPGRPNDKAWLDYWMSNLHLSKVALVNLADEICLYWKKLDGNIAYYPSNSIPSGDLTSVHFFDANNGWAIGNGGWLVRTRDGGATWTPGVAGASTRFNSIRMTGGEQGCAVGESGTIACAVPGSPQGEPPIWSLKSSGTTATLNGLHFANATSGWAVGDGGVIRKTSNSGSTWTSQSSGTTQNLLAVHFADANNGWAVGAGGTIRRTTNGGSTWSGQTSGTTRNLNSVHFIGTSTGWAVGDGGVALKTTNGGTSWAALTSGTTQNLRSVRFASSSVGWMAGNAGVLRKTANGGTSWSGQASGTSRNITSLTAVDANNVWGVGDIGDLGTILHTTNGGTAWSVLSGGINQFAAVNNPKWMLDIYAWYRTRPWATAVPISFETTSFDFHEGPARRTAGMKYKASPAIVANVSDWLYRNTPAISAASLEFYFYLDPMPHNRKPYEDTTRALLNAYFNSTFHKNTQKPLWIDEYGHLICGPGQDTCTATEANQANYYEGFLRAVQDYPSSKILGIVSWDGSADYPFAFDEHYGLFITYDSNDNPVPRRSWARMKAYATGKWQNYRPNHAASALRVLHLP